MAKIRQIAVEVLQRCFAQSAYSKQAINAAIKANDIVKAEAGFLSQMVLGVIERKITLDFYIDNYSKTPTVKMDLYVLCVLRLSVYQLKYMDNVFDTKAVNDAVDLIKQSKFKHLAGYTNAVLRAIIRDSKNLQLPSGLNAYDLSIRYSCEKWICMQLIADYGNDVARSILEESLLKKPICIRVNTTKITPSELKIKLAASGIISVPSDIAKCALILQSSGDITQLPGFVDGLFHVQDAAAQMICSALNVSEGMSVLDACAAPGGKTFTLAQTMNNTGKIVACDMYETKTTTIGEGASRLGLSNITELRCDSSVFDENLGTFDRILCDVPCSGFGVMGTKPEIKYKTQADCADITKTQGAILNNCAKYLRSGGMLVYSTCTLFKSENEQIVEQFLAENKNFSIKNNDMRTILPNEYGTDGFFYAVLIKE